MDKTRAVKKSSERLEIEIGEQKHSTRVDTQYRSIGFSCFLSSVSYDRLMLIMVVVLSLGVWTLYSRVQYLEGMVSLASTKQGCDCSQAHIEPMSFENLQNGSPDYPTSGVVPLSTTRRGKTLEISVSSPRKLRECLRSLGISGSAKHSPAFPVRLLFRQRRHLAEKNLSSRSEQRPSYEAAHFPPRSMEAAPNDVTARVQQGQSSADFVDVPEESGVLSRHTRQAERSSKKEKSCEWKHARCKEREDRISGECPAKMPKPASSITYEAEFYKIFDYDKLFNSSDGSGSRVGEENNFRHLTKWNTTLKVYMVGVIQFDKSGIALPFYDTKTKPNKRLLNSTTGNPGQFSVEQSGLYLLLLNITIMDKDCTDCLTVFHNNQPVLSCQFEGFQTSRKYSRVCNLAGSLEMKKKDVLEIRTMAPNMGMRLIKEAKSYFRLVLVKTERKTRRGKKRRKRRHNHD